MVGPHHCMSPSTAWSDCSSICSPTRELRALGIANIVGSMFTCYTNTGSFSRSAVMDQVGSRTQLAGFVGGELLLPLVVAPCWRDCQDQGIQCCCCGAMTHGSAVHMISRLCMSQGSAPLPACSSVLHHASRQPMHYSYVSAADLRHGLA